MNARIPGALIGAAIVIASLLVGQSRARADNACTSLPASTIYGNWFSGSHQDFGATISGARGYIRTYNPFVYYDRGGTSAWVMGVSGARFAQSGWAKDNSNPASHSPYSPNWFIQYTDAAGNPYSPVWYGAIAPPTEYFYQANSPAQDGRWTFQMGPTIVSGVSLGWLATGIQAFGEEFNYSGDQTAGDRTAHTTFRSIQWSNFSSWQYAQFGGPSNPYQAGTPSPAGPPDRGTAGYDALTAISGSDFDIWDNRCP